ncbi:MAG: helix-turn-helix domain-containing protein, partial [bacterium]
MIETALKAFAQYGFDGTTVRMICKEAGASPGLINYYWGGTEELWQ